MDGGINYEFFLEGQEAKALPYKRKGNPESLAQQGMRIGTST
jgi:hypothetical protein